jgi:hypothetical protein
MLDLQTLKRDELVAKCKSSWGITPLFYLVDESCFAFFKGADYLIVLCIK